MARFVIPPLGPHGLLIGNHLYYVGTIPSPANSAILSLKTAQTSGRVRYSGPKPQDFLAWSLGAVEKPSLYLPRETG